MLVDGVVVIITVVAIHRGDGERSLFAMKFILVETNLNQFSKL